MALGNHKQSCRGIEIHWGSGNSHIWTADELVKADAIYVWADRLEELTDLLSLHGYMWSIEASRPQGKWKLFGFERFEN